MASAYKLAEPTGKSIIRVSDGISISASCFAEWAVFQDWLAQGNTPDPVDPPHVLGYRELRAAAYPPIGDQLDAFWKGGPAAADMLILVNAVKAKYPKP